MKAGGTTKETSTKSTVKDWKERESRKEKGVS